VNISRIHIVLAFLCLSIGIPFAEAQHAIQVVSITQKENYAWNERSRLFINGEQADIEIITYSGNTLKCEIVRASRHSSKEQAEKDLKKLKLLADQSGRTITLRNYVELSGSDERPESKLKTTYKILVPQNAKGEIEIWNYFGTVTATGLSTDLEVKLEFTNLNLTNFSGNGEIEMKYGEATLKNTSGTVEMNTNRTNVNIENLTGSATIESKFTELRLLKISRAAHLSVDAEKSELFIDIPAKAEMAYEIKTKNVEVNHLSNKELEMLTEPDGSHRYNYKAAEGSATAEINLNTGTLNYIVQ